MTGARLAALIGSDEDVRLTTIKCRGGVLGATVQMQVPRGMPVRDPSPSVKNISATNLNHPSLCSLPPTVPQAVIAPARCQCIDK